MQYIFPCAHSSAALRRRCGLTHSPDSDFQAEPAAHQMARTASPAAPANGHALIKRQGDPDPTPSSPAGTGTGPLGGARPQVCMTNSYTSASAVTLSRGPPSAPPRRRLPSQPIQRDDSAGPRLTARAPRRSALPPPARRPGSPAAPRTSPPPGTRRRPAVCRP